MNMKEFREGQWENCVTTVTNFILKSYKTESPFFKFCTLTSFSDNLHPILNRKAQSEAVVWFHYQIPSLLV